MKNFIIILSLLISGTVFSQNTKYSIHGSVEDEAGQAIPFCNVGLYDYVNNELIAGSSSDNNGEFKIQTTPGTYKLKVSFISFSDKVFENLIVSDQNIYLGKITLSESVGSINEVVVVGMRKLMELGLDKRIYNVDQDMLNSGANAAEILNNIPSVDVDIDGNISLRNSSNVQILVDGKKSALTGIKSTDALRNLQGSMIEQIEILTNPSARQDASGEAGIINIILKKNRQSGFNGNFSALIGYPERFGGSYSVNYRTNNINLFSSYGTTYQERAGSSSSTQFSNSVDTSYYFTQTGQSAKNDFSHNFMFGIDYFFDDNTTLTGSFLYEGEWEKSPSKVFYNDYDPDGFLLKSILRTDNETARGYDIEAALNFRKEFDGKDHTFTADTKWLYGIETEKSDFTEGLAERTGALLLQKSVSPASESELLLQSDYVRPIFQDGKFETGIKNTFRNIFNDYIVEQQDELMEWNTLTDLNNKMRYHENIYAAYVMASNKFGNLSAQGGLRGEFSDITTKLTETDEINNKKYFNLFPSASLSYEFNKQNTLQLSYSYRINRPRFYDLVPFGSLADSRTRHIGNPDLAPEYTHSTEISYLFDAGNFSFLPSIFYRYKTGVVEDIIILDSMTGITYIKPVNMATQNNVGLDINAGFTLWNNLRINNNFNLYKSITDGIYEKQTLHSDALSWTNRISARMTLFQTLTWQTIFNYRAPRNNTQSKTLASHSVDTGLSVDIFNDKGTLTLNIRDVFNTRKSRTIINLNNYHSESIRQFAPRQFTLNFSYRINQKKNDRNNIVTDSMD